EMVLLSKFKTKIGLIGALVYGLIGIFLLSILSEKIIVITMGVYILSAVNTWIIRSMCNKL
ncbi:hypothetical protein K8R66_01570, partial [bacterium]|nr:hypothetical protein [bacterium]